MFKTIFSLISDTYKKLGIGWTMFILLLTFLIIGILKFDSIVMTGIEVYDKVRIEKHEADMRSRDELNTELHALLREYRAETHSDRLLYFEYHNSKENLVGIPFKYVDLVLSERAYGISGVSSTRYKDINAGLITDLYEDLVKKGFIINDDNLIFLNHYSGISDFLGSEDGTSSQFYVNIPGISNPIGFIILEWVNDSEPRDWDHIKKVSEKYIPRINALIINKSTNL